MTACVTLERKKKNKGQDRAKSKDTSKSEKARNKKNYPGGESAIDPPESMPNSEVKCCYADGSVGIPHVRVGHCQV